MIQLSATNRGYVRHKSDYYVTPIHVVEHFLNEFQKYETVFEKADVLVLDPSAGGDSQTPMSYPEALKLIGVDEKAIKTMDIREDSLAEIKGDYTEAQLDYKPSVIITNPPFVLAREFIEKALDDVAEDGFVVMLLRLNFFGSQKRFDMWQTQLPKYSFVHSKRIGFTSDGKTDSIEYQHMVFQKGHYPEFTKLQII